MSLEHVSPIASGHIRIYPEGDPQHPIYEAKNVIVNGTKSLFARMAMNLEEPLFGIWGLSIGSGDPAWSMSAEPPAATATQYALNREILRKKCSTIRAVESDGSNGWVPATGAAYEAVDFQTVLNASLDNILVPIMEMGLIGGGHHGTTDTDMTAAPFWVPTGAAGDVWSPTNASGHVRNPNSVTLVNYRTLAPLSLPAGVSMIFSWVLRF